MKQVFGYDTFRAGQLEGVTAILNGQDVLILVPTGGGKPVIYSIPTLMMPGLTIVVSPLLMLMLDQTLRLREKGINTCYVNSMLSEEETRHVIANLSRVDTEYKVLLCSPEVVLGPEIQGLIKKLCAEKRLNFFAIDEAHCIDTWGKDLRQEYQELGLLKCYSVPVAALTATATKVTIAEITTTLRMKDPCIVKIPCFRDNLRFEIIDKKNSFKESLNQVSEVVNTRFFGQCGIVYCNYREDTSDLALELKKNGITSIYFHGGIVDPEIKKKHTNLWLDDKVKVMCATNAFGMGIDKPDVNFVVHLSFPASYEAYVQESGRASRDGRDATCIILYKFSDRNFHLRNISKLQSEDTKQERLNALNQFTSYLLNSNDCRQRLITEHFESELNEECGKCDNCQRGVILNIKDYTCHARTLVSCLQHMIQFKSKVTVEMLVMTYLGSKSNEVKKHKFEQVPEYGQGKGCFKFSKLASFVHFLIVNDLFTENWRNTADRAKSTFLTVGNIRELLSGEKVILYV